MGDLSIFPNYILCGILDQVSVRMMAFLLQVRAAQGFANLMPDDDVKVVCEERIYYPRAKRGGVSLFGLQLFMI